MIFLFYFLNSTFYFLVASDSETLVTVCLLKNEPASLYRLPA